MAILSDEEKRRQREAQEQALREANPEAAILLGPPRASEESLQRRRATIAAIRRGEDLPEFDRYDSNTKSIMGEHGHPITPTWDEKHGTGRWYREGIEGARMNEVLSDRGIRRERWRSDLIPDDWQDEEYIKREDAEAERAAAHAFETFRNTRHLDQGWPTYASQRTEYRDITPPLKRAENTRGGRYIRRWLLDPETRRLSTELLPEQRDLQEQLLRENDPEAYRRHMAEKHGKE